MERSSRMEMIPFDAITRRHACVLFLAVCLCTHSGCSKGPKVVPVSGVATLDGQPLSGFSVTFVPDEQKGNTLQVDCSARLGADGKYSLMTDDRYDQYRGAPPGWYKVTLWSQDDKPIPVHQKFTNVKTSPLEIEVVADAPSGAYDLKFSK